MENWHKLSIHRVLYVFVLTVTISPCLFTLVCSLWVGVIYIMKHHTKAHTNVTVKSHLEIHRIRCWFDFWVKFWFKYKETLDIAFRDFHSLCICQWLHFDLDKTLISSLFLMLSIFNSNVVMFCSPVSLLLGYACCWLCDSNLLWFTSLFPRGFQGCPKGPRPWNIRSFQRTVYFRVLEP